MPFITAVGISLLPPLLFSFFDRGVSIFAQCRHYKIISGIIQKSTPIFSDNSQTASILLGFAVMICIIIFFLMLYIFICSFIEYRIPSGSASNRDSERTDKPASNLFRTIIAFAAQIASTASVLIQTDLLQYETARH